MKNKKWRWVVFCLVILNVDALWISAWADSYTGEIYQRGSAQQKTLYRLKREEKKTKDGLSVQSLFSDPSDKPAVAESTTIENGQIKEYRQIQHQIGAEGVLTVEGNRIKFRYTRDGKTKSDEESLTDNFIIAPTTVEFIAKHWKQILNGETVDSRFAVLDRVETVGFKFFKVGETQLENQEVVIVKMKPTSFIIAAIVDPILFYLSKSNQRLLKLDGRVPPKQFVDGKWKDLDAEIIYRYK
ncbi:MAG: hypothetical protein AABZ55_10360 [Bdellovibrionota bacterium]